MFWRSCCVSDIPRDSYKMMNIRQKIVTVYCFLFLYTPLIKERFMEKYIIPMNNKIR